MVPIVYHSSGFIFTLESNVLRLLACFVGWWRERQVEGEVESYLWSHVSACYTLFFSVFIVISKDCECCKGRILCSDVLEVLWCLL